MNPYDYENQAYINEVSKRINDGNEVIDAAVKTYILNVDRDGQRTVTTTYTIIAEAINAWEDIKEDATFTGYAGMTTLQDGIEVDYNEYLA